MQIICGISITDLLAKVQISSKDLEKQRIDIMKKQFSRIGNIQLSVDKKDTIPVEEFIRKVNELQELGMDKSEIAQVLGMSEDLFGKKYKLFKAEIDTYKIPTNIKQQLNQEDVEFIEELKKSLKKANENKTKNMKYSSPIDDELVMINAYLKLKEYFLKDRNEGLIPGTIGYIDQKAFFKILRENPKLLTNSLENKIKPITKLVEKYYTKSQANTVIIGFPRIYGASYQKLNCNLEIAKDESCLGEMLMSPKNYMCSPGKLFTATREWKLDSEKRLVSVIARCTDTLELPRKYKNILEQKNKRTKKRDTMILE